MKSVKSIIFLVLFCSLAMGQAECRAATYIKICILKTASSVQCGGEGRWKLHDSRSGRLLASGNTKQTATVSTDGRFLSVNGSGRWIRLRIDPVGKGSLVSINGRRYRGRVYFWMCNCKITVVNTINLEEYLYGVIKEEMYITSPMEALKAQAVMSRTFALKSMERHGSEGYALCSSTHCQMYGGVESEDPRAKKAVDSTRNYILKYKGELISGYFTSVCGGYTAANNLVWNGGPISYLQGVRCPYCSDSPNYEWEVKFTGKALAEYLRKSGYDVSVVEAIKAVEVTPSGRIRTLEITHPGGTLTIGGNKFRLAVDPRAMKSTRYTVRKIRDIDYEGRIEQLLEGLKDRKQDGKIETAENKEGNSSDNTVREIIDLIREKRGDPPVESSPPRDQQTQPASSPGENNFSEKTKLSAEEPQEVFLFQGRGYGHGIGLCQWGARNMAKRGYRCQRILKHYYPGVKVRRQ